MTEPQPTGTTPLGHPDNPRTRRAPIDAVMLTQALHRDDEAAQQVILGEGDPYSIALQLAGLLLTTFRHFAVDVDGQLGIWLATTTEQCGEDR